MRVAPHAQAQRPNVKVEFMRSSRPAVVDEAGAAAGPGVEDWEDDDEDDFDEVMEELQARRWKQFVPA